MAMETVHFLNIQLEMGEPIPCDYQGGVCGCCNDMGICCYGYCCWGCQIAENWSASRDEHCDGMTYCCIPSWYWTRRQILAKKGDPKGELIDCCTVWCCPNLVTCQDARELQAMGLFEKNLLQERKERRDKAIAEAARGRDFTKPKKDKKDKKKGGKKDKKKNDKKKGKKMEMSDSSSSGSSSSSDSDSS